MSLKLNTKYLADFINDDELAGIKAQVETAAETLHSKSGLGNDFLGWVDLPTNYDKEEFARIKSAAEKIKSIPIFLSLSVSAVHISAQELLSSF